MSTRGFLPSRAVAFVSVLVTTVAAGSCSSPTAPAPPVLQMTCPPGQEVETPDGSPIPITYATPTTTGGTAPVTTTCVPLSGTPFSVGTTTVSCSARDNERQTAACSFPVTVARIPELTSTRFMAFGDSITAGALSPCPVAPMRRGEPPSLEDIWLIRATVSPAYSYPTQLHGLLAARYRLQTPVVVNEGFGGERITDNLGGTNDATFFRFRSAVNANRPQVVLLQEGINDLNQANGHVEIVNDIVKGLGDLAREARNRGALVMVGTLLPQEPGACRALAPQLIAPANDAIRALAARDGLVLVDLYQGFNGVAGPLIGVDGLHPNELGYQRIAETFVTKIRETLEVK